MENDKIKTLLDVMPSEFLKSEHKETKAFTFKDLTVIAEHCRFWDQDKYIKWPGSQKNVHHWVELENGYAVGWNENPAKGWSFPVIKVKDNPNV